MSLRRVSGSFAALMLFITGIGFMMAAVEDADPGALRMQATQQMAKGNFKDAYATWRSLLLNPKLDQPQMNDDLTQAVQCLQRLGLLEEQDEFVEAAVVTHPQNWRLLHRAGLTYLQANHYGMLVSGKFERGGRSGQGQWVNSLERDHVRAMQLFLEARRLAADAPEKAEAATVSFDFANALINGVGQRNAWALQALTDLKTLPDFDPAGWSHRRGGGQTQGAPVDADGQPVYHRLPESFDAAVSDGERWRWLLHECGQLHPARQLELKRVFADFCHEQFGEQTLASFGWFQSRGPRNEGDPDQSGTWALHTLSDEETIAKLAIGVRRFKLPDEFNFIRLYREIAEAGQSSQGEHARTMLASIAENRRQYPKAAERWREAIEEYGPGPQNSRRQRLDQIVDHWGRFEMPQTQPAGRGAVLDYRFRNGREVRFEAFPIDIEKLLAGVKQYLKTSPGRLDWNQLQLQNIGQRIVAENQQQYLKPRVAAWAMKLEPRPDHVDDRVTVTTPLQEPGAYLLTARMTDGNISRVIVWVDDTVIVRKPLRGQQLYFIADAVNGQPVEKANVEFFGYRVENINGTRNFKVETANFSEFSSADGLLTIDGRRANQDMQWLTIARTPAGRLAFLGFDRVWFFEPQDEHYRARKVFTITDRPVYRPGQKVQFKFWVGEPRYDQPENESPFAGQTFRVTIQDPQGSKVLEKDEKSDRFGGLAGEYVLPDDAKLGAYSLFIEGWGGNSFRVEEYKKPEFEVSIDAPSEPVQLGDHITATIRANYYFGASVTKATVKYKVQRTPHDSRWFPAGRWDWFYGRGYRWFAEDYDWYPGWNRWGCLRPVGWWWPQPHVPPEIVAEGEAAIGEDGTLKIDIDTSLAKAVHGDQDHRYEITAEVVDESRRTIVGQGQVLVSREPFKVFAWIDRGYSRTGDTIEASFQAQTLDQKPVAGKGVLTLLRIRYENGEPVEEAVEKWELAPNAEGRAVQKFKAGAPGQYRLSYQVTDAKEHSIEGGYVFTVIGQNFDGRQFRFNDLELITDKSEYAPGETVRLLINANQPDTSVLLFLRPSNNAYLPPKLIRLKGKSTIEDIAVAQADMPNFFIEALAVSNAKLHSVMREVVVPPEKRIINVEVLPSAERYQPGQDASIQVKLTDQNGEPVTGSTVLSVYDRSVEYISGGSNVPEIREFFWKWRRHHHPTTLSSLSRWSQLLFKPSEIPMSDIGLFGGDVVEELRNAAGDRMFRKNAAPGVALRGMALDASAPAGAVAEAMSAPMAATPASGPEAAPENAVQPTVRSEFADTAFWAAALTPDPGGVATVSFKMPENLTGWKLHAWSMGAGTRVGEGTAEVVTAKNILVRMQAPRFFVEKDEVILSANVHNYLAQDKDVFVQLELDGNQLSLASRNREQKVRIPAGGEMRVDWLVKVTAEGDATIRMKALTDEESDAMQMTFPCYVHGMLKTDSFSGFVHVDDPFRKIKVRVPEERRPEQSRLEVRYSPTLAGAMVDALPYLAGYPYGCTEQTLNRFLPSVITQRVLQRMNLDLKAIREKRTNLNAQEIGDDAERAKRWQDRQHEHNPVFDDDEVARMVKAGIDRLTNMQLSDGGWGWFSGYGEYSSPHTTAVVVHGLQIAAQNDVALVPGVLERGVEWLRRYQAEQLQHLKNHDEDRKNVPRKAQADNLDAFVFMILNDAGQRSDEMRDYLDRDRVQLSAYGKALFGLALHQLGDDERLSRVLENLSQFVVEDPENQTAYLRLPEGSWWYWHGSEIEASAWYLKLLARTQPRAPRTTGLVKYLLNNRRNGTYWRSTRDTAYCIEALAEYLTLSGEDRPDMTIEVLVDGKVLKTVKVDASNLFSFDNRLVLEGDALTAGEHTIEVRRQGRGPVYFNAYLTNFTLEDFITKSGLEVKVDRKYFKLERIDATENAAGSRGQVVGQKVEKYRRTELVDGAELKSGDLVEVELTIESKNDYEYLVFEDMKAAGFEPVELRSGYGGRGMSAYIEYRDEKVALFARWLPRGTHSTAYRLRAEIPGRFSALPTKASAMYAPELKANSDEIRLRITDRE